MTETSDPTPIPNERTSGDDPDITGVGSPGETCSDPSCEEEPRIWLGGRPFCPGHGVRATVPTREEIVQRDDGGPKLPDEIVLKLEGNANKFTATATLRLGNDLSEVLHLGEVQNENDDPSSEEWEIEYGVDCQNHGEGDAALGPFHAVGLALDNAVLVDDSDTEEGPGGHVDGDQDQIDAEAPEECPEFMVDARGLLLMMGMDPEDHRNGMVAERLRDMFELGKRQLPESTPKDPATDQVLDSALLACQRAEIDGFGSSDHHAAHKTWRQAWIRWTDVHGQDETR